eukprot:GGOE01024994.1.p2 GENE.GGOE01024994.1~~GGOE01024994.1.p2  ORF type:complete len:398 (-),score=120.58 GGOE01024994.1:289-1446(-)
MADKYTATTLSAFDTTGLIRTHSVQRRKPTGTDVFIQIKFCGICHTDLHQLRGEWPINCHYPMTAGHEIAGIVEEVGPQCTKFKPGDRVGVGCFINSCLDCEHCREGEEQFCPGMVQTYNHLMDGEPTHGGYASSVTVREEFVVRIPDVLPLQEAAPLLCAGITMYSPLVHFGARAAGPKYHVGVIGLGGLGSMGVKYAKAMGNKVTVLSRGSRKKPLATQLGAGYLDYLDPEQMKSMANQIDLIIDTVSAPHEVSPFFLVLKASAKFVMLSPMPDIKVSPMALIFKRISLAGSLVGGLPETQEMLDFSAAHGITVDVEPIDAKDVNHALHKLAKGVNEKSRYVIRIAETLSPDTVVEPEPEIQPSSWQAHCIAHPPEANVHTKL